MLYSDFAATVPSTTADTDVATTTITYNGFARMLLGFWGVSGAQTDTAAQAVMTYAKVTGYGMPGVVPSFPVGRWRSSDLIGASTGSRSSDATFLPIAAPASPAQVLNVEMLNAASSAAPKGQVGVIYSDGETLPVDWALLGDPWNLRAVPHTYASVVLADNHGTTETSNGSITIPTQYPTIVGLQTSLAMNGVRVTAEELLSTTRYTATGIRNFEPSQKWPTWGQQDAPAGTDIQDESFVPSKEWHPILAKAEPSSTITSLDTLQTAATNAVRHHFFAALL